MDDKAIIALFWQRSERAIPELTGKYGRLVLSVAMNILHSAQDSEECVNDGCLGMWNSLPPERPTILPAYFTALVRNAALKLYRYRNAKKRCAIMCELSDLVGEAQPTESESGEITRVLNKFLESLDKNSRLLFMRRYYLGMSVEKAALTLGITGNNASVKLSRLRAKLRKMLESEGITI